MCYPLELRYCIAYGLVKTALPSMGMSMFGHFIDIVSIHLSIGSGDELCVSENGSTGSSSTVDGRRALHKPHL